MLSPSPELILNSLLIQEKKSGPNFKITKGVSKDIGVTDNRVQSSSSFQFSCFYIYTRTHDYMTRIGGNEKKVDLTIDNMMFETDKIKSSSRLNLCVQLISVQFCADSFLFGCLFFINVFHFLLTNSSSFTIYFIRF